MRKPCLLYFPVKALMWRSSTTSTWDTFPLLHGATPWGYPASEPPVGPVCTHTVSPGDIDAAVDEVERAGGKLLRRGEFSPGYPYAYVHDPDGYEVEIWYE